MDDQLKICTLGGLTVLRNDALIADFEQRKVPALLVYLACARHPQPREVLAELFWEGRTQSQSLTNLRGALTNLRKTVGSFVDITRETAGMRIDSSWWLDAIAFEQCLEEADVNHTGLVQAVSLYQGDFLDGFYIDSQGFEDWRRLERERLRFRAVAALDALIDHHTARGDYPGAIDAATRLLHLDNLREETHRALMALFAQSGQRNRALTHYEQLQGLLADELGVEPLPDTVALYERIQAGDLPRSKPAQIVVHETQPQPSGAMSLPAAHHLPVQSTSFVGREHEITQIIEHLRDPDCRLLSLVGPGGIGKTRLALAIAERVKNDYSRGAHFVSLVALTSPGAMAPTIAAALGLQFLSSTASQEQQLINYLRAKEMLIILDNIEHLLEGLDLVDRILTEALHITLIATSREMLNLDWERRYDVHGLTTPDDSDTSANTDAVRLFIDRARSAQPAFRLADEYADVIDICQRVEGLPLAIELAASWLRVLPCRDIAGELFELESHSRQIPQRHRSLRALFDHTWMRLSEREKRVFRAMAVFRGGFSRQAAEAIMGATLPLLARLVNKALLRVDYQSGRYHVHEVLRQYAEQQLDTSGEREAVRDRHSAYYLEALAAREPILETLPEPKAFDDIETDFENVRAAWFWGIRQAYFDVIARALETLQTFCYKRIRFSDGNEMLGALIKALETERPCGSRGILLGRALDRMANFQTDNVECVALCSRSVAILRQLDAGPELAYPLKNLALFADYDGDFERGNVLAAEALAVAEANEGSPGLIAWIKGDWGGGLAFYKGELDKGEQLVREALELRMSTGAVGAAAWHIHRLATIAGLRGHYDKALQLYQEALAIHRDLSNPMAIQNALVFMGSIAYDAGQPKQAVRYAQEALAIMEEHGNVNGGPHIVLSYAFQVLNDDEAARRHLRVGLRTMVEQGMSPVRGLASAALFAARAGKCDRAVELVALALSHPSLFYIHKRAAERVRDVLYPQLTPKAFEAAWARGEALDLEDTVREILADLEAEVGETG